MYRLWLSTGAELSMVKFMENQTIKTYKSLSLLRSFSGSVASYVLPWQKTRLSPIVYMPLTEQ